MVRTIALLQTCSQTFCSDCRHSLYKLHVMSTTFCALFEITMSVERLAAIVRPRRYHFSDFAWFILWPLTAMFVSYLAMIRLHGRIYRWRLATESTLTCTVVGDFSGLEIFVSRFFRERGFLPVYWTCLPRSDRSFRAGCEFFPAYNIEISKLSDRKRGNASNPEPI